MKTVEKVNILNTNDFGTEADFNSLSPEQKAYKLSDAFGEIVFSFTHSHYNSLTSEQQEQVKEAFYNELKAVNAVIDDNTLAKIQSINLRNVLFEFLQENSIMHLNAKKLNEMQGEKVTIIKFSDFGFPIAINTTIKNVTVESYAQYDEALFIIHRPKRKRSNYRNIILPRQQMLVYKGWIELTEDFLHNTSQEGEMTIKQSKYSSFDQNYIRGIEKHFGNPIVKLN